MVIQLLGLLALLFSWVNIKRNMKLGYDVLNLTKVTHCGEDVNPQET